jgi:MEDS: MEthanogen/methylotroph, DcmR Sensory domain
MKHPGFQHEALIYAGADEYLAGTIPFLRAGFEAGQPVLVAAGLEQTEILKGALGTDAGLVRFLDMREVGRNPAAIIPVWREFVEESGGRPVRGIGEPVWAARSPSRPSVCTPWHARSPTSEACRSPTRGTWRTCRTTIPRPSSSST